MGDRESEGEGELSALLRDVASAPAFAPPPRALAPGDRLATYTIDAELGRGGMGAVYRATHTGTGRAVALKVITPRLAGASEAAERFRREAKAMGRLHHPHVVDVSDFGVDGERLYLVMELLSGRSLRDELKERKTLPLADVVDIIEQVASALDAAHATGIVHRDLKPENIQLVPTGDGRRVVKVLDFGIAKMGGVEDVSPAAVAAIPAAAAAAAAAPAASQVLENPSDVPTVSEVLTGAAIIGTPLYMSPEQLFAQPADARSDVYALALIARECLTGTLPRTGDAYQIISSFIAGKPIAPLKARRVPRSVAAHIDRSLARAPAERAPSAGAFASLLRVLAAGEQRLSEAAVVAPLSAAQWVALVVGVWLGMLLLTTWTDEVFGPSPIVVLLANIVVVWSAGGLLACRREGGARAVMLGALGGPLAGALVSARPRSDLRSLGRLVAPLRSFLPALSLRVLLTSLTPAAILLVAILAFSAVVDLVMVAEKLSGANASWLGLAVPLLLVIPALFVMWQRAARRNAATARLLVAAMLAADGTGPIVARPQLPRARALLGRGVPVVLVPVALLLAARPMLEIALSLRMEGFSYALTKIVGADTSRTAAFDPFEVAVAGGASLVRSLGPAPPGPYVAQATALGDFETLLVLGEAGADMNTPDANGRPPLVIAADLSDPRARRRCALTLLRLGADPDVRAADGRTGRAALATTVDDVIAEALVRIAAERAQASTNPAR